MPTSPSLLLVFAVGRTGSVGGPVVVLTTDVAFEDEELLAGVTVETSSTVLGDNWSVDTVVVFEVVIIKVNTSDTFTRVPATLVDFRSSREVITSLTVDDVSGVLSDDDLKSIDEDLTCTREVAGGKTMVVEGFFTVEYTGIPNNDVDDATLAEDGNNNVTILLVLTVIKLDPGVTRRDEIKVSVENTPIVLVRDIGLLTLFTLEGDGMNALVEETVKITEVKSDTEGSMNIRLLFVE